MVIHQRKLRRLSLTVKKRVVTSKLINYLCDVNNSFAEYVMVASQKVLPFASNKKTFLGEMFYQKMQYKNHIIVIIIGQHIIFVSVFVLKTCNSKFMDNLKYFQIEIRVLEYISLPFSTNKQQLIRNNVCYFAICCKPQP